MATTATPTGSTPGAQESTTEEAIPPKSRLPRIALGLLLSIFGGVLLILTFPNQGGIWPLVFIGFIPMYIAQYRVLPRKWSAVPVGITFFAWWFAYMLTSASIMSYTFMIIGALVFGVIGGVIGIFQRPFSERTGYRWFLLQLPLIWVAIDLLTTNDYLGSEQYIAYHLGLVPQIVQPVSVVSTPVLSFLIIVINSALALLIISWMDRKWPHLADVPIPKKTVKWSAIIAGIVTLVWLVSSFVIYNQVTAAMGPTIRIAGVTPGLDNFGKSVLQRSDGSTNRTPAQIDADLQAQLTKMTEDAAKQGAQIVVWPEETLNYDPLKTNTDWIPALAKANNVYIETGYTTDPKIQNQALMFSPSGLMGSYGKVHRVLLEGEDFPPGTVFPTFETAMGPVGVIICWDMDFPNGPARLVTLTGSEIVLVPSVDFGSISKSRFGSNVFRAIENRVGIVKVDRAWDSRMVNPNGQVIAKGVFTNKYGDKDLMIGDVARGPRNAPFTQLGSAPFAFLVFFFLLSMVAVMFISSRRSRKSTAQ